MSPLVLTPRVAPCVSRRHRPWRLTWYVALLSAAATSFTATAFARAQAPVVAAQGADQDVAASGTPAATADSASVHPATAPRHLPRWLAVNGYVTQAGGVSRGGTMSGVPSGGTVDYRRLALLVRVQPTGDDRFVFQLANRRVGASPNAQYQPDVKVDWLFYEHAFGDATHVRAGRVPLPFGIYNETRYVGTLLPFYQTPTSVYREKEFATESADGAVVTHEFDLPARFGAELTAYAGRVDYVEASSLPWIPTGQAAVPPASGWTYATARAHARGARGAQLWVTTPIPGLRAGIGALRTRVSGGLYRPAGQVDRASLRTASLDGSFERFTIRSEAFAANLGGAGLFGTYVQAGARVAGPLSVYVQHDYSHMHVSNVPVPPTYASQTLDFVQNRDHAVSAVWALRRGLQLRAEGHRTLGYNADEAVPLSGPARRGRYAILSVSAAF